MPQRCQRGDATAEEDHIYCVAMWNGTNFFPSQFFEYLPNVHQTDSEWQNDSDAVSQIQNGFLHQALTPLLDMFLPQGNSQHFNSYIIKINWSGHSEFFWLHAHVRITTGWSKWLCFFLIFLWQTLKNGRTQPFLLRIYLDILIFWCLSMARWRKYWAPR